MRDADSDAASTCPSSLPGGRRPRPGARAHSILFTNHAYVLAELIRDPGLRLRDVAERTGITERSAQRIVKELEAAGYLRVQRAGLRNRYRVGKRSRWEGRPEDEFPLAQLAGILGWELPRQPGSCAHGSPSRRLPEAREERRPGGRRRRS